MSYPAYTIADYFLSKASEEGRALTPMQLIKLVYIAHGWHLGYYDKPLITDEVEAWQYGPVIDSLYQQVKRYGSGAVTDPVTPNWLSSVRATPNVDPLIFPFLNSVWDAYKQFSGVQLSSMTHQHDTPWDITWNQRNGRSWRSAPIDNEDIKKHYKAKIASASK